MTYNPGLHNKTSILCRDVETPLDYATCYRSIRSIRSIRSVYVTALSSHLVGVIYA